MPLDPSDNPLAKTSSEPVNLRLAIFWAAFAALATIALFLRHRHLSLDGDYQGWASASCLVMARAFNQLGALHSHFVPIQNNLPVGNDPDVYLHWPPLYPLTLAFFLRVFGDQPASGRLLAILISLGCGALVLLIAKRLYSLRVGLLAVFFYFTSRAVFEGNSPLLQQPLAMLFALLAVYCFLRATSVGESSLPPKSTWLFGVVGCVSLMLTIAAAWDPIFIPFGLLATALWLRQRTAIRLALAYCAVVVLTFAGIEVDYVLSYPKLFANQFATIAYRAGMHFNSGSSVRLHTIVDRAHFEEQYGLVASYWRVLKFVDIGFPALLLVACCVFLALWFRNRGNQRDGAASAETISSTWLIGGLLLPAVVWYVLMRNYVAHHSFPLVLPAPFVAIACAFLLDASWTRFAQSASEKPFRWVLVYALPLIVIHPLLVEYRDSTVQSLPEFSDFSPLVEDNTPATAVVLTPTESLVPTYYSHRHLVRGIETDDWLAQATVEAHQDFPGAPLFFALRDTDAPRFHRGLSKLTQVARRGDSTLYSLP